MTGTDETQLGTTSRPSSIADTDVDGLRKISVDYALSRE